MRWLASVALFIVACSAPPPPEETDAGAAPDAGAPPTITFRLRFVSDIPETIYVQASGMAGYPEWITMLEAGGDAVKMFRPCEICECGECEACGVCGASMPVVEAIDAGGDKTLSWTATAFPWGSCGSGRSCYTPTPLASGSYTARFCWGTASDGTGMGHSVVGITCADVPFAFPVPGGVVSYTVDRGG